MILEFPPAFDINYYRQSYPELRTQPDEVVREHYRRFAEEQGRTCCVYDFRETMMRLMNNAINNLPLKVLEIGPSCTPSILPPKTEGGGSVKYFDVVDAEELKKRETKSEPDTPYHHAPEKIDYVSPHGDFSIIDEQFDVVFSSHSIEHQMNLVKHLQAVERILNDGGLFVLVIPDKRYCFDHYRQETTIAEVLDRYFNKVDFRPFEDFIDYEMSMTHNGAAQHWLGDHGDIDGQLSRENFEALSQRYIESQNANRYIDVHSLKFTPRSFEHIINTLNKMELTRFKIHRLCHTVWGRFEFSVVLKKF